MDDLESGSSDGGSSRSRRGPKIPLPEEEVGTSLSPAKVTMWKTVFGVVPICTPGHYNPHGMLAAQRFVAERKACDLLKGDGCTVVDVGGAPHRTFRWLEGSGRYLMPNFHLGDSTRYSRCPKEAKANVCRDAFEDCRCHDGDHRKYLFVHSAYYLEPLCLWSVLTEPLVEDAIAVEHFFDDAFGGYYDEASWHVDATTVTMTVVGNGRPYVHTLPPWQCDWRGPGGEAIEAEVLETVGVTRIVRLHPTRVSQGPPRSLTWGEVEADPLLSGPVQFSAAARPAVADNARFTGITFDVQAVQKFGPVLYSVFAFKGEEVRVTVPINGVSFVATHVLNRPRTPELYAEVTHVVKNRYARARIPPSRLAATLGAIIALGFVVNLNNEIDLTHTMLQRFSWAMKAHSVVLGFGTLVVRSWPWLLCISLLAVVPFVPAEALAHGKFEHIALAVGGLLAPLFCVCFVCAGVRVQRAWRSYLTATWVSSYADQTGPTSPLLPTHHTFERNQALPASHHIRPANPDVQGRLDVGVSRERVFENERMLISGIVANGAAVNALATTQEAELSAVTNRVLVRRENPERGALDAYAQVLGMREFGLKTHIDTGLGAFNRWAASLREKYPADYVDNLTELWKTWQGRRPPPVGTKAFLKIEKSSATIGVDGAKTVKPRLIQPPEDLDKAMTGYIIFQLYDAIRHFWDGRSCSVCYATGRSADYLGELVDDFIREHIDVVAWSADQETYDATLNYQLQVGAFSFYEAIGAPKWLAEWLVRVRPRGRTVNGVLYFPTRSFHYADLAEAQEEAKAWRKKEFKVQGPSPSVVEFVDEDGSVDTRPGWVIVVEDFQMTSGRMDTNLTDTVVLVGAILSAMPSVPYLLLVCGDDAFLMLRRQDAAVVNLITARLLELGLKPGGVVSSDRSDWEFCSKLFWFGVDPATGKKQTVLGAKPFRGISRMGFNTTLPGSANAAAAALSVRVDSGHVPFLGPFADRTYQLCSAAKIKPRGRPEWQAIRGSKRFDPCYLNYAITQARYGLGEVNEAEFKRLLAGLTSVPIVIEYGPLRDAVRRDEA